MGYKKGDTTNKKKRGRTALFDKKRKPFKIYLNDEAKAFLREWAPLKATLAHKPFNPDSEEYRALMDKTMLKIAALQKKYPNFAL